MERRLGPLAAATAFALCAGAPARADNPPLTASALGQCASQVQSLRAESARLIQEDARLDQRHDVIDQRARDLDAEGATLPKDDLRRGLDYVERRKAHQAEAIAFNTEIDHLRRDIDALNQLKARYESSCAGRHYQHRDFAALSPVQQQAMRAGLTDVVVPYLDPAVPGPGTD